MDGVHNLRAVYWFWHPQDQQWYDVIAAGNLNIKGWVKLLRETGFCTCVVKHWRQV